jgi:hypothetical protein
MKNMTLAMVAAVVAGLGLTSGAASAQAAGGWWEWALPDVVEARGPVGSGLPDVLRGQGKERSQARRAQAGPPFCRNGQGHPVHGRQWCRDKGFGTGGVLGQRWEPRGWDDVILRAPRGQDRRSGAVDRGGLIDVLGDVVFGRITAEGARLGASEPLTGRWVQGEGGAAVLQIRSGVRPVAELTDLNGDGRVNAVLVSRD